MDGDITLQRRWYEMKIKNKMNLRKVLHDGNFNCIVVWQDGIWTDCEKRSVEDSISQALSEFKEVEEVD